MIDPYPERPIEQTPENYRELQAMVFYADPLFIGRNGAWISSQAVLLAIAVAQFKQVPASMVLTLAVSGVLVSLFWFFTAKSLGDRITWLDNELCKFEGHSGYVYAVAFCPDGRFAVSGSSDKTVRMWRLPR